MALNPSTNPTMAGRTTAPAAEYPYGSSKDETLPGLGDGMPYFKARADDILGMQQALLNLASIVPSGNADNVLVSDYMKAFVELVSGRAFNYDDSGAADAYVLGIRTNQYPIAGYFKGLRVLFSPDNTNTGASTANVSGLGVVNIKLDGGVTDPGAGDIVAGKDAELIYRTSPSPHFELLQNEALNNAILVNSVEQTKIGDLTIGESVGVDSWSFSGTTITVNTAAVHNLSVGQFFLLNGLVSTTNAPNGRWSVATVVDDNTITFTSIDTPTGTPTISSATLNHGDMTIKGSFKEFDLGQKWEDVSGSRSTGVTYTNTTGKPIFVIPVANVDLGESINFYVDGNIVATAQKTTTGASNIPISVLVPNNSTYQVTAPAGSGVSRWSELR